MLVMFRFADGTLGSVGFEQPIASEPTHTQKATATRHNGVFMVFSPTIRHPDGDYSRARRVSNFFSLSTSGCCISLAFFKSFATNSAFLAYRLPLDTRFN